MRPERLTESDAWGMILWSFFARGTVSYSFWIPAADFGFGARGELGSKVIWHVAHCARLVNKFCVEVRVVGSIVMYLGLVETISSHCQPCLCKIVHVNHINDKRWRW